jgi:phosphoheptose isomerase
MHSTRFSIPNQYGRADSGGYKKNNKLMLCGNGGSAADAQHLSAEMLVCLRPKITSNWLVLE